MWDVRNPIGTRHLTCDGFQATKLLAVTDTEARWTVRRACISPHDMPLPNNYTQPMAAQTKSRARPPDRPCDLDAIGARDLGCSVCRRRLFMLLDPFVESAPLAGLLRQWSPPNVIGSCRRRPSPSSCLSVGSTKFLQTFLESGRAERDDGWG